MGFIIESMRLGVEVAVLPVRIVGKIGIELGSSLMSAVGIQLEMKPIIPIAKKKIVPADIIVNGSIGDQEYAK